MVAAFFDVDGTLTATNVILPLLWFHKATMPPEHYRRWLLGLVLRIPKYWFADRLDRRWFVQLFFREYKGLLSDKVQQWHEEQFVNTLQPRVFPQALQQVRWHQSQGHLIVLVTGGASFVTEPLARWLSATLLATQLEVKDGHFTGRLATEPLIGKAKAKAIQTFAAEQGVNLADSFAYGDDVSDAPMLASVGHPVAVNPDRRLLRLARQRGWAIVHWR